MTSGASVAAGVIETMDGRRWKVGELAEATGITVRALHHFDQIGLVRPTERSAAGHRLYTGDGVRRLYRALALRELGMPLSRIGESLDGGVGDLRVAAREQLDRVLAHITAQQQLRRRLVALLDAADRTEEPSLDQLIDVMEAMMKTSYFTAEQLEQLENRHRDAGDAGFERWRRRWAEIAEDVATHISAGRSPADPAVQDTARAWQQLMDQMTNGDRGILASMYAALDGKGPEAATGGVLGTDVWNYMKQALAVGYGSR